jgi:hypothetical protein
MHLLAYPSAWRRSPEKLHYKTCRTSNVANSRSGRDQRHRPLSFRGDRQGQRSTLPHRDDRDGIPNPVVWIVGAQGDNRLHGFKGDTGEPLLPAGAGPAMVGLRHFQTLIATRDRLYVGADGRIYAFTF